ncbi:DUF943 family protein [Trabulsiella odontotermitis]|uniref:Membrane protein n=1 Tax=Trabulsiella odontotermitis TaxID=379893 RepID=A0A0L0GJD3_9ENTR|nr:DUF943 family protein [Trabulsiella odontotermitis]KNC89040.1 membrane protein [Trabulsiella odontotermitis]KNC89235.1 membrane protein [Trabulsiella odontotermitis]
MKRKFPKLLLCLFLTGGIYNLWTLRPVNILYVYSDAGSTVSMVVDHLPWTDRDKIAWYLTHRDEFKRKYPLSDENYQTYYITDIGEGFTNYEKSPHEDLRCYPTLKNENNCIVKNYLLIVDEYAGSNTRLYIPDSETDYQLTPDNKLEVIYPPKES